MILRHARNRQALPWRASEYVPCVHFFAMLLFMWNRCGLCYTDEMMEEGCEH